MEESNKTVRAITGVTFIMLSAKLLAMVRNILQARVFGAGTDMDLFTSANNYTISIFTTIAYALCVAAVPVFSRRLSKSKEQAFDAANHLLSIGLILSTILAAVLLVLDLSGVIPMLAGADGQPLFLRCFARLLLSLPIILAVYLLLALFQAMGHYNVQASLSLVYNVALCALLLLAGEQLRLETFALVTAAAWLFQLAMIFPIAKQEHYRFRFALRLRASEFPHFLSTALVTTVTTSVFLLCYLMNTRFASSMIDGTVSAYYYADKIFEPLATTIIYSIGIVMFPKFNQKYEQLPRDEYCSYVSTVVCNSLLFLLPVSLILSVFGTPIIKVLFEGGNFDATATTLTGGIFAAYAIGICGFFLLDLLSKAHFAMESPRTPLIASLSSLLLCAFLNTLSVLSDDTPVWLLALGTSVSLLLGGVCLFIHFCRTHRTAVNPKPLVWGTIFSLLIAAVLRFLYLRLVPADSSKLMLILSCGSMGVVGMALYVILMGRMLPTAEILRKLFRRASQ